MPMAVAAERSSLARLRWKRHSDGDKVVVISGSPPGIPGGTNDIRVHTVGYTIGTELPAWLAGASVE
ncbi:hypothetical protein EV141_0036 [Microcella putealis]|uniref:Uncharacterized protein n=1 Tax=Microcella putealis TaxID=337005 RepID=A0A4Q7LXR2_9MICO|nr:hypothetical protein [Microcella putealis]RZS58829.1 hypothetical protein EV141_0036 [Microcella putealis]TQM23855.1 hypothetical protein BJ957_1315 [Microcella putealis]